MNASASEVVQLVTAPYSDIMGRSVRTCSKHGSFLIATPLVPTIIQLPSLALAVCFDVIVSNLCELRWLITTFCVLPHVRKCQSRADEVSLSEGMWWVS